MSAAAQYAERVAAALAQNARLVAAMPAARQQTSAPTYLSQRALSAAEAVLASYIDPEDVVVDVGGASGRLGLMLALRCREVVNVEPNPRRGAEFEQAAAEAGITNVRLVSSDWMSAGGVEGDVTLASHVVHFTGDVVPFVHKLIASARRRVIVVNYSQDLAEADIGLLREAWGEEPHLPPDHRHLLPVLWEMGILPDVRVLGARPLAGSELPKSRDDATRLIMRSFALSSDRLGFIEAHFDEIFASTPEGFRPRRLGESPEVLITWAVKGADGGPEQLVRRDQGAR